MHVCLKSEEDLLMGVNNDDEKKNHLGGHWKF
jgi:hypothetical protein